MSRYKKRFAELKNRKEGAFIPFAVLGDPDFATSKKILEKIARHADILELGFPFSDPIADGRRIQAADERALSAGITPEKCFRLIRHVRKLNKEVPIGLLLYYNLVYSNGAEKFLQKAKEAGVDGVLIADMPLEESREMRGLCRKAGLELVFIVAPTTSGARMGKIASAAKGFVYTVGVLGVTGERKSIESSTIGLVRKLKRKTKTPVCVGFGISKPGHVAKVIRAGADGAIAGSATEAIIEKNLGNRKRMLENLEKFVLRMKEATRND